MLLIISSDCKKNEDLKFNTTVYLLKLNFESTTEDFRFV